MATEWSRNRQILSFLFVVAAISICVPVSILKPISESGDRGGRRSLGASTPWTTWGKQYMVPVTKQPDTSKETAIFWHVPKSGGTTIKNVYCFCMGLTIANRVGADPKYGHDKDDEIVSFPISKTLTAVNVDVLSQEGILRARDLGLVPSKKADLIITMDVMFAGEHLFDEEHRGRILAVFRHPVERLISLFYYLRVATWEKGYKPDWNDITLLEWATNHTTDEHNNYLVHRLSNKRPKMQVDESDVSEALHFLERRVMVGLTDRMEETVRRFNVVLGLDEEKDEKVHKCMQDYFGDKQEVKKVKEKGKNNKTNKNVNKVKKGKRIKKNKRSKEDPANTLEEKNAVETVQNRRRLEGKMNANKHPKYGKSSPEWKILSEMNNYDIMLYENIVRIFNEQKSTFNSFL